nr:palmitoyltransferase ZDHHC22-like [Lytechinus pictus]
MVTAFYSLFLTALYLSLAHSVEFPGAWTYFLLLPRAVVGWFSGHTDVMELAFTLLLYIQLVGGFVAAGFFVWQIFLVITGLTTHEALYGEKFRLKRQAGMYAKWTDVFGKYWFIGMVVPLPFPQCGNGLYEKLEN